MISYIIDGVETPLDFDKYYRQTEYYGWENHLFFSLPVDHPQRGDIIEQTVLIDRETGNRYRVAQIDEGTQTADYRAYIDLSDWQETMLIGYNNGSATPLNTVMGVLPSGWHCASYMSIITKRTITADGATPLDVVKMVCDTWDVAVQFDTKTKYIRIYRPSGNAPSGVYYTDELNLTERPQYKGSSTDFYTRLYAYGKDGLSFADINDGKPYVEDTSYSGQIISRYWKDDRYTVKENLLEDAQAMLADACIPTRSYSCKIVDLAKIDPQYATMTAEIYKVVTLIDRKRQTRTNHRVVTYREYPHYPEKNVITLSTKAVTVMGALKSVQASVDDTAKVTTVAQRNQAAIDAITALITGNSGGAVILHDSNNDGKPDELLIMDTDDIGTATRVMRFNNAGIGFSLTGYDGEYTTGWTIDGQFLADIITAGTLRGIEIIAENGKIGGFSISQNALSFTFTYHYREFTQADIDKAQRYIVDPESNPLDPDELIEFDVNMDGAVTSADLLAMSKMLAGTADTYSSGVCTLSTADPRNIVYIEIVEGYGEGRYVSVGVGGVKTSGTVISNGFTARGNLGTSLTDFWAGAYNLSVVGGIITKLTPSYIGQRVNGSLINVNMTSSWTDALQITLGAGTWIVVYGIGVNGIGAASLALSTNYPQHRVSVSAPDGNYYWAKGCEVITLTAQTTITAQTWSASISRFENWEFYAVKIGG